MKLKDICKQHTIVGEDGVNYCDTDNCPFAKRDLGIDFMPTDHYSCIADYPYLKEKHETDLLKEFVEWFKNNYYFAKYPLFAKNTEELIEKFMEEKK